MNSFRPIALLLVVLGAASSGCASDLDNGQLLSAEEELRSTGAQRTGCDGDADSTTVGPLGSCKEILLSRSYIPSSEDTRGRRTPARWETPARWDAYVEVPLGLRSREVSKVEIKCRETGDSVVRAPLLGVFVTFSVGAPALFGAGMKLVPGDNHCSMQITRRGQSRADAARSFVLRATKKVGEQLPE